MVGQTIKQLRTYFHCLEQFVSLVMHSNVIRELQNNSLIMKYKLSLHGNCNCMAPGF